jgi:hypothetical protein
MPICLLLAAAIFSPLLIYAAATGYISTSMVTPLPKVYLVGAVSVSAVLALFVTFVFYKVAIKNAEKFLILAEWNFNDLMNAESRVKEVEGTCCPRTVAKVE